MKLFRKYEQEEIESKKEIESKEDQLCQLKRYINELEKKLTFLRNDKDELETLIYKVVTHNATIMDIEQKANEILNARY